MKSKTILTEDRIEWIDMAKGLGILLVILGHLDIPDILRKWVYTFHMPLFYFLSGVTFSAKKTLTIFLQRNITTLLIPYFAMGTVIAIADAVLASSGIATVRFINMRGDIITLGEHFLPNLLDTIAALLIQTGYSVLWYIASLFVLKLIFRKCLILTKYDVKKMGILSIIFTIIGLCYYIFIAAALPWRLDVCGTAFIFMYVGYYCNKLNIRNLITSSQKKIFIIAASVNMMCFIAYRMLGDSTLEMSKMQYGNAIVTYFAAFSGILCSCIFADKFKIKVVKYIGNHSLIYYAWHQALFIPLISFLYKMNGWINLSSLDKGLKIVFSMALILILSTALDLIIRKTKLKFMIGK